MNGTPGGLSERKVYRTCLVDNQEKQKMKKNIANILLLVSAFCALSVATAQGQAKVGWGSGGKMQVSEDGTSADQSSITNFHIGGYVDIPLAAGLSMRPGFFLQGKGTKDDRRNTTFNYQTLDIPIHALFHLPIGGGRLSSAPWSFRPSRLQPWPSQYQPFCHVHRF